MSREIKFRAWNNGKNRSRWLKPHEFAVKPDGEVIYKVEDKNIILEDEQSVYEFNPLVNIILIQYTGLHDKNGKEIYEGDILSWDSSGVEGKWVVKAVDGGWNPFIADMQTDGAWHYEVIGNIYENPELLEDKNV